MSIRALFALLAVSAVAGCAVSTNDEGTTAADEEAVRVRMCPMIYDPVCGHDGETYSNACVAGKVKIAHKGECTACDETKCAKKTHCELQTVYCIKAPCPPIAKCVADVPVDACAVVRCAAGFTCQLQSGGLAACVPLSKDFCNADQDCKLVDDYCGGCQCLALASWAVPPSCSNPVNCFAQPCMNKTVACESNHCVLR